MSSNRERTVEIDPVVNVLSFLIYVLLGMNVHLQIQIMYLPLKKPPHNHMTVVPVMNLCTFYTQKLKINLNYSAQTLISFEH